MNKSFLQTTTFDLNKWIDIKKIGKEKYVK